MPLLRASPPLSLALVAVAAAIENHVAGFGLIFDDGIPLIKY